MSASTTSTAPSRKPSRAQVVILAGVLILGAGTAGGVLHATRTPPRTQFSMPVADAPAPAPSPTPVVVTGPAGPVTVNAAGVVDPRLNADAPSTAGMRAYQDKDGRFIVWDTTGPVPASILEDATARVATATHGQDTASSPGVAPSAPGTTAEPTAGGGALLPAGLTAASQALLAGTGKHLVAIVPPVDPSQPWAVAVDTGDYTMSASRPDQASARAYAAEFIANQSDPSSFILVDQSAH